jgi:2-polyprenyl-3-methyl-5-hydroxy-6-metoxy-1,4-benzoquinol methylase
MPELCYHSVPAIFDALNFFRVENLRIDPEEFERVIRAYISNEIVIKEACPPEVKQGRTMRSFVWGHDHDFGSFKLSGLLGTRHVWMLSRFFDHFGLDRASVAGKDVLDVGCYTGGVSLVLQRFGARVSAIDAIRKYVHALNFLITSFGLQNLNAYDISLYRIDQHFGRNRFDIVFCLGVIYHLTDPLVGLRRLYHALKPGGLLCIESMSIAESEALCEYEGRSSSKGEHRGNWFVPSPKTLTLMLKDSGFEVLGVGDGLVPFRVTQEGDPMGPNRCFAIGKKIPGHMIYGGGFSIEIV